MRKEKTNLTIDPDLKEAFIYSIEKCSPQRAKGPRFSMSNVTERLWALYNKQGESLFNNQEK